MTKKRKQARAAQAAAPATPAGPRLVARNQYDAAGHGRRMRGWTAPSSGPNRAVSGLTTIRNRARDATRNEWTGAAGERVWGTNLIGTGIIARPKTKDPALKDLFAELWERLLHHRRRRRSAGLLRPADPGRRIMAHQRRSVHPLPPPPRR